MSDFSVGTLAARTGLTVRTLHHYDTIGLLAPSGRTEAGYRLYSEDDLRRLERVVLLRALGIPLRDIAMALSTGAEGVLLVLERHAGDLRRRIRDEQQLVERVEHIVERIRNQSLSSADEALDTIQFAAALERHFDSDQIRDLRTHAREVGETRIREVEAEWPRLIAAVRHEMNDGAPPAAPQVLALARRWQQLVEEFVNGRSDIAMGVGRMMHTEPAVRQRTGLDAAVVEYISRATAALSFESAAANAAPAPCVGEESSVPEIDLE
jgi:DNA-binding transcriptional MerR regulator